MNKALQLSTADCFHYHSHFNYDCTHNCPFTL